MTTQAQPDLALDEDETVALWEEHLAPIYKGAKGFQGAFVLGNSGDRKGLTITLWNSEEDADNSGTFEQVLPHIRDTLALPPTIDGYDVIFQTQAADRKGNES